MSEEALQIAEKIREAEKKKKKEKAKGKGEKKRYTYLNAEFKE